MRDRILFRKKKEENGDYSKNDRVDLRRLLPTECDQQKRCAEVGGRGADIADTEDPERGSLPLRGISTRHVGNADSKRTAGHSDAECRDQQKRVARHR